MDQYDYDQDQFEDDFENSQDFNQEVEMNILDKRYQEHQKQRQIDSKQSQRNDLQSFYQEARSQIESQQNKRQVLQSRNQKSRSQNRSNPRQDLDDDKKIEIKKIIYEAEKEKPNSAAFTNKTSSNKKLKPPQLPLVRGRQELVKETLIYDKIKKQLCNDDQNMVSLNQFMMENNNLRKCLKDLNKNLNEMLQKMPQKQEKQPLTKNRSSSEKKYAGDINNNMSIIKNLNDEHNRLKKQIDRISNVYYLQKINEQVNESKKQILDIKKEIKLQSLMTQKKAQSLVNHDKNDKGVPEIVDKLNKMTNLIAIEAQKNQSISKKEEETFQLLMENQDNHDTLNQKYQKALQLAQHYKIYLKNNLTDRYEELIKHQQIEEQKLEKIEKQYETKIIIQMKDLDKLQNTIQNCDQKMEKIQQQFQTQEQMIKDLVNNSNIDKELLVKMNFALKTPSRYMIKNPSEASILDKVEEIKIKMMKNLPEINQQDQLRKSVSQQDIRRRDEEVKISKESIPFEQNDILNQNIEQNNEFKKFSNNLDLENNDQQHKMVIQDSQQVEQQEQNHFKKPAMKQFNFKKKLSESEFKQNEELKLNQLVPSEERQEISHQNKQEVIQNKQELIQNKYEVIQNKQVVIDNKIEVIQNQQEVIQNQQEVIQNKQEDNQNQQEIRVIARRKRQNDQSIQMNNQNEQQKILDPFAHLDNVNYENFQKKNVFKNDQNKKLFDEQQKEIPKNIFDNIPSLDEQKSQNMFNQIPNMDVPKNKLNNIFDDKKSKNIFDKTPSSDDYKNKNIFDNIPTIDEEKSTNKFDNIPLIYDKQQNNFHSDKNQFNDVTSIEQKQPKKMFQINNSQNNKRINELELAKQAEKNDFFDELDF